MERKRYLCQYFKFNKVSASLEVFFSNDDHQDFEFPVLISFLNAADQLFKFSFKAARWKITFVRKMNLLRSHISKVSWVFFIKYKCENIRFTEKSGFESDQCLDNISIHFEFLRVLEEKGLWTPLYAKWVVLRENLQ